MNGHPITPAKADEKRRRGEALRANLRRRKAAAAGRPPKDATDANREPARPSPAAED